jgi:2-polyprenyl-6-methoxyphenol hydroxylase-like FAD-dependent oxidoreductase
VRIVCVGGGPASLYFSILMKRHDSRHDITVLERNPAGSTYGWGVTYWGSLLDRFHDHDPETAQAIADHSVRWADGVAYIGDAVTTHHGDEGFSIGRQQLLDILADRARRLGVTVEFEREVESLAQLPEADLVVAGDGVNSRLRQLHAEAFGPTVAEGRNRYIWLGTTKVFDSFTFSFVETDHGWIWCYAYGFSADLSTFIVECSPETWTGLGLDRLPDDESMALLGKLFERPLDGHPLINQLKGGGTAPWLTFRTLTNASWYHGNLVLLGDAAHTTHYSIGAGTKLALEDAIGLADALCRQPDPASALAAYERERKSAILSTQSAARYSAQWYESIPRYIHLEPAQLFALLGQRHSPLLPHVPPQMYYWVNQAAEEFAALKKVRRWLGPKVARTLHGARRGQ